MSNGNDNEYYKLLGKLEYEIQRLKEAAAQSGPIGITNRIDSIEKTVHALEMAREKSDWRHTLLEDRLTILVRAVLAVGATNVSTLVILAMQYFVS